MDAMSLIVCASATLLFAWAYFSVAATVSLSAATSLTKRQKVLQRVVAWCLPFLGAWLVLHLLAESEPRAVSTRMVGSSGLGWYIIAGAYEGPWHGACPMKWNSGGDPGTSPQASGQGDASSDGP